MGIGRCDVTPLASVIVPVYDVGPYLGPCVASVIGQTYQNLEIILVDDGSTDDGGLICDMFAELDQRITVVHGPNRGLSTARNCGIELSSGLFVLLVDADDWIDSDAVRQLVTAAISTGADVTCGSVLREWIYGSRVSAGHSEELVLSRDEALIELLCGNRVGNAAWGKLYRRGLFEDVLYPAGRVIVAREIGQGNRV